jgi:hypothetical protein
LEHDLLAFQHRCQAIVQPVSLALYAGRHARTPRQTGDGAAARTTENTSA